MRRALSGVVPIAVLCLLAMAVPAGAVTGYGGSKPSCAFAHPLCVEVHDAVQVFHKYVGHDEPSLLFYSSLPGSGNHMKYSLTIPSDPSGPYSNAKSYNFELHPAFWFGMDMCDTQSFPERESSCTPDSDSNIADPATTNRAPGGAFMELQFYPPGWVPQFAAQSCDPVKWCVALTIDSLSENPITGTALNPTCQSEILGGVEYVNFAFLTLNGTPIGAPNPLQFNPLVGGNPVGNSNVLFLNPGDKATVTLNDTSAGLEATVADLTTKQTGTMVASAANGFGQIKFQPNGHKCTELPYSFHPMFSTSSPRTRVLWTAHGYNVAFSDEVGHFDFCTSIDANTGACNGLEGAPGDQEPADGDDFGCFAAADSLLQPATGCTSANDPGFDGPSYLRDWPDGNPNHPTPIMFTSPLTGTGDATAYSQAAFETDLPAVESNQIGGPCDNATGIGCSNPPVTDDGGTSFYPFYSTVTAADGSCQWELGNNYPAPAGASLNDFGGGAQYGGEEFLNYWIPGGHGKSVPAVDDFHNTLQNNPC